METRNRFLHSVLGLFEGKSNQKNSVFHDSYAGCAKVTLVKGNRRKSTPYKAGILAISRDFPKKEKALIPPYYAEKKLLKFMNAWVKIGHIEQMEMSSLKNLKTINSIFPLEETLVRSSSGYFLVHESKSIY
jgi:hypothetical protein